MPAALGPTQNAAFKRLSWRPELAAANDRVMTSLARRGLAVARARDGGVSWHITAAGADTLGIAPADPVDTTQDTDLAA